MKLKFFINEMNIFLAAQYNEVINSVDVVFMNLILDLMEIGKITTQCSYFKHKKLTFN